MSTQGSRAPSRRTRPHRRVATTGAPVRRRLFAAVVVVVTTCLALAVATVAFAGNIPGPKLTPTDASFAIPKSSSANWTINLWSAGQLLGTESGTGGAGPLTVAVPAGTDCHLQADVLRNGTYFAGVAKKFASCGPSTVASTTTTVVPTPPTTTPTSPGGTTTTSVIPVTGPGGSGVPGGTTGLPTPGPTSSLPFTGPGPGLWRMLLAGLVLVDVGTLVFLVQPAGRRVQARRRGAPATARGASRGPDTTGHAALWWDATQSDATRAGMLWSPRPPHDTPGRDTLWLEGS